MVMMASSVSVGVAKIKVACTMSRVCLCVAGRGGNESCTKRAVGRVGLYVFSVFSLPSQVCKGLSVRRVVQSVAPDVGIECMPFSA